MDDEKILLIHPNVEHLHKYCTLTKILRNYEKIAYLIGKWHILLRNTNLTFFYASQGMSYLGPEF